MKYLYKGMGMPGWGDVSGSVLLGWHEKVSILDAIAVLTCLTFWFGIADRGCGRRVHRASHDRSENSIVLNVSYSMYVISLQRRQLKAPVTASPLQ
jgi:hypothetical protein